MSLHGKKILITGASRGIGREIALKAAADGAHIAILAKTEEPHPKLDGTIYSVAKEIEQAGGIALPIPTDIRFADQVQAAVQKTEQIFGGIDILVNNASAIHLADTLNMPLSRLDLMLSINVRGTFVVSQACIPALKQSANPHIVMLSPEPLLEPRWFKDHAAYTLSKYGMSFWVTGMAEELRADGVAVNGLWPKTLIATAALNVIGGDPLREKARYPSIVADAFYALVHKESRHTTGHFFTDEALLESVGVTDFSAYAVTPGGPVLPDLFVKT